MKTKTPLDLFFDQLRDLYSAETQLSESLPKLVTMTSCPELRELLLNHSEQTNQQQTRLLGIFDHHGVAPGTDKCKAMEGLIEGGEAHLRNVDEPRTRDLMMIAHCLRVEYYEIAAYGITHRLGERLGFADEAAVLKQMLSEEEGAARGLRILECSVFDLAIQPANSDENFLQA